MKNISEPVVAVFGAHTPEPGSPEYQTASHLGALLARSGFAVSTGGYGGTMAGVSEGASQEGGLVIGVSSSRIEQFRSAALNTWITREVRYVSLQERILHLVTHNEAMIALPGGIGTLTEFALAWNLIQVGELPQRPLILLGQMWRETISQFWKTEYVPREHRDLVHFVDSPEEAVDIINKWILSTS